MTSEEYEQLLSETDSQIDRLHALYEQWFQGLERREPVKPREMVHKRLETLRSNMPRNTALRFRCQGLLARWVTLTHHWNKVGRQIEEGTYKRDIFRARKKADERAQREKLQTQRESAGQARRAADQVAASAAPVAERAPEPDAPHAPAAAASASPYGDEAGAAVVVPRFSGGVASSAGAPARPGMPGRPGAPAAPAAPSRPGAPAAPSRPEAPARPAPPAAPTQVAPPAPARPGPPPPPGAPARPAPPPPPPPPARPAAPAGGGAELKPLFERYVEAKRQNNERVDNVRIESLQSSIDKLLPDLQKKHAGKQIDFEVVVKDGRVGLKPIPK